jgi:hypothetical protein
VETAPGYYVISTTEPPARKATNSRRGLFDVSAIADQISNDAQASTTLTIVSKTTGERKIQASRVEERERGGRNIVMFFFPRDREIQVGDEEVLFESDWHTGLTVPRSNTSGMKQYWLAIRVKAKFTPKQMVFNGHLEL